MSRFAEDSNLTKHGDKSFNKLSCLFQPELPDAGVTVSITHRRAVAGACVLLLAGNKAESVAMSAAH